MIPYLSARDLAAAFAKAVRPIEAGLIASLN